MTDLTRFVPILMGLLLTWFVVLGTRELFKEASIAVMKKTNA